MLSDRFVCYTEEGSLAKMTTRCQSLLLVIRFLSLYHSLPLVVPFISFIVTCCHLLFFVIPFLVTRCHSMYLPSSFLYTIIYFIALIRQSKLIKADITKWHFWTFFIVGYSLDCQWSLITILKTFSLEIKN